MLLAGTCQRQSDGCAAEETRCDGTAVEVCASDGVWEPIMDCEAVSNDSTNNYVCCLDPMDGTYSCLLADQCAKAGD